MVAESCLSSRRLTTDLSSDFHVTIIKISPLVMLMTKMTVFSENKSDPTDELCNWKVVFIININACNAHSPSNFCPYNGSSAKWFWIICRHFACSDFKYRRVTWNDYIEGWEDEAWKEVLVACLCTSQHSSSDTQENYKQLPSYQSVTQPIFEPDSFWIQTCAALTPHKPDWLN